MDDTLPTEAHFDDQLQGKRILEVPIRPERKKRFTVHLPESLINECRNCTVFLSGPPRRLTLSALVERALALELRSMKDDHNHGKDFPSRKANLKGGRPIHSA